MERKLMFRVKKIIQVDIEKETETHNRGELLTTLRSLVPVYS